MAIEIIPTGAALGAEICGVNLAQPLEDASFAAIERAYNDHGVIFFRDQQITPPQQVAFTRRFGEIEFNIFGEPIVICCEVLASQAPVGAKSTAKSGGRNQ
jgi:taurine dioxygenase